MYHHALVPNMWYMLVSKNAVHVSRAQIIAEVWQVQLVGHVLGDPLRQLEWKELQSGMVPPVCLFVSVDCP
jgi:hypothetical protein